MESKNGSLQKNTPKFSLLNDLLRQMSVDDIGIGYVKVFDDVVGLNHMLLLWYCAVLLMGVESAHCSCLIDIDIKSMPKIIWLLAVPHK